MLKCDLTFHGMTVNRFLKCFPNIAVLNWICYLCKIFVFSCVGSISFKKNFFISPSVNISATLVQSGTEEKDSELSSERFTFYCIYLENVTLLTFNEQ